MNEVDCIRKACAITNEIFSDLFIQLKKKKLITEKQASKWLLDEAKKRKCDIAFRPIVVTAGNYEDIHHKPTDLKIKKGFLIVDFGVKYNGYCADMTRTFYCGKPNAKENKIYDLVLSSQETALIHCVPGNYAADVDLVARTILLPYFRRFKHSLGHGVGKRVHTKPNLKPRSRFILKKGQAVTIEPGLYFKDMAIRIEDTVIVNDVPEVLTKMTKKLLCF